MDYFFENKYCKYYPCHKIYEINCLFCYCPLFHMENCPGNPKHDDKVKDCSNCAFPHRSYNIKEMFKELEKLFKEGKFEWQTKK